jgi:hypothetical protein
MPAVLKLNLHSYVRHQQLLWKQPLLVAVQENNVHYVEEMLTSLRYDFTKELKGRALLLAVRLNFPHVVKRLLAFVGNDINPGCREKALQLAMADNRIGVVISILSCHRTVAVSVQNIYTCYVWAGSMGHHLVLKYLLTHHFGTLTDQAMAFGLSLKYRHQCNLSLFNHHINKPELVLNCLHQCQIDITRERVLNYVTMCPLVAKRQMIVLAAQRFQGLLQLLIPIIDDHELFHILRTADDYERRIILENTPSHGTLLLRAIKFHHIEVIRAIVYFRVNLSTKALVEAFIEADSANDISIIGILSILLDLLPIDVIGQLLIFAAQNNRSLLLNAVMTQRFNLPPAYIVTARNISNEGDDADFIQAMSQYEIFAADFYEIGDGELHDIWVAYENSQIFAELNYSDTSESTDMDEDELNEDNSLFIDESSNDAFPLYRRVRK